MKSDGEVAVPSAVAKSTEIGLPEGAESETVNVAVVVPTSPSRTVTLLTETVGAASLSVIVPIPWLSPMVALEGLDRSRVNVSLNSFNRSPVTATSTVWVVTPGTKVSVVVEMPA